jgi:hypothetical protein
MKEMDAQIEQAVGEAFEGDAHAYLRRPERAAG